MKDIIHLPAEHYLNLIKIGKPFSFSRFGDGEVLAMRFTDHKQEANCDGNVYLPELADELRAIFFNQHNYYHCLLNCSFWSDGDEFKEFLDNTCPDMPFYDGEVWQHLSFGNRINELIAAMNKNSVMMVGGEHIANVHKMIGLEKMGFIQIPTRNSYLIFDRIFESILKAVDAGYNFIGFSAGYTTKILIDKLFPVVGDKVFLIDFGSVFDPYCGVLSRDGMQAAGFSKFQPYTMHKLI